MRLGNAGKLIVLPGPFCTVVIGPFTVTTAGGTATVPALSGMEPEALTGADATCAVAVPDVVLAGIVGASPDVDVDGADTFCAVAVPDVVLRGVVGATEGVDEPGALCAAAEEATGITPEAPVAGAVGTGWLATGIAAGVADIAAGGGADTVGVVGVAIVFSDGTVSCVIACSWPLI